MFKTLVREAKERGPKGYIGGGVFFLVVGLIIGINAYFDPTETSVRGFPYWALSAGLVIVGLIVLIPGLIARRDRAK
ncbi:hypothetical protein DZF95_01340 [Clavibacter michiganensis]|jgi:hypothetical protein|nr:hypothetical protein DZF95_01340 [Clavibacter michiganensis]